MSEVTDSKHQRYLGLELAGAKNHKTALAILEYYRKEQKIFLLDIHDRLARHCKRSDQDGSSPYRAKTGPKIDKDGQFDRINVKKHQSGDEALLEVICESSPPGTKIGVNVPLTFPPCTTCQKKHCPLPTHCTVPAVRWMREVHRKSETPFTPYTQRPVELWVRHKLFPKIETHARFEIDEALGGNKAPLTSRMAFLTRHLSHFSLIEVWPKLTLAVLSQALKIPRRLISTYRHLDEGAHARNEILKLLSERCDLFIYERDQRKLSRSLAAFDALLCAYTALLEDIGHTLKPPHGFPIASGWVQVPRG